MAYTDYDFYTDSYYGTAIESEDDFIRYAERASDRLDALTFDRLVYGYPDDERADKKIQKAVCTLAESMYYVDLIKQAAIDSVGTVTQSDGTVTARAVTSISSGSESISFSANSSSSASTISYGEAAADFSKETQLYYQIACTYLTGVRDSTGEFLLHAGF